MLGSRSVSNLAVVLRSHKRSGCQPRFSRFRFVFVVSLSSLFLFLVAGVAWASRGHVFSRTFGEKCIAEPCIGGQLKEPVGVAVNEASGAIYVVDEGANRVVRFSKEGVFLGQFNGSGEVELGGVKVEGTAAGGGGNAGEVPTGRFEEPEAVGVDNSCSLPKLKALALIQLKCEAQDPSIGL